MRHVSVRFTGVLAALSLALAACSQPSAQPAAPQGAPAAGGEKMTVKFSHVVSENTPKGGATLRFAEEVKKRSNGNIEVQVYANSALYKDAEEMDAIAKGQVEFLAPSTAKFSVNSPEWQVFDLPYMFGGSEGVKRVADGPVGKELYTLLGKSGMVGLAIWDNGFRYITNSKRQIKKPEDFRGLKFRAQGKTEEATLKVLGGGAQVMAFSEVFGALQQGVVDGQMNTWSNTYTQKFHEVQKYATIQGPMNYLAYAVVANKAWWDGLKPDTRKVFEDSMKAATDYEWELAKKDNDEALAKIKETNKLEFYTLTKDEEKAFREATTAVYKEYEGKIPKDLLEKVQKESGASG